MKSFPKQDSLELEVVNFGPISRAKIDLRPLTVFIGPSNTGKSYLTILIYALHNYFNVNVLGRRHLFSGYGMPEKAINSLASWAQEAFADGKRKSDSENIVVPVEIADLVCSGFSTQNTIISNEIVRCFGVDEIKALIRKGSGNGSRITLRNATPDGPAAFESRLTIKKRETEFKMTIPEDVPLQTNTRESDYLDIGDLHFLAAEMVSDRHEERSLLARQFADFLAPLILSQMLGPLRLPAFYIPADRTAVMHAHGIVVSTLIRNAAMAGVRADTSMPMLSGVLADFLEQLIQFAGPRRRHHGNLGKAIEESLLNGSVYTDKWEAADYPLFKYRPKGWDNDLNLMNASSMVSELAPVVLYLRYRVRGDNVLIVEEPESHLHPAMQVEFTRQLAALVRSGIRVIVTTHSEWLLEELANLVHLSKLSETGQKGIDNSNFALSPEQVGAWLFQPKNNSTGSVVKEVELNDSGLYESGFGDVADVLYNKWAEISGRIEEDRCRE